MDLVDGWLCWFVLDPLKKSTGIFYVCFAIFLLCLGVMICSLMQLLSLLRRADFCFVTAALVIKSLSVPPGAT